MGMSEFYGPGDDQKSIYTIHRALELGITLLDTADMYGPYLNEELVGLIHQGASKPGPPGDQVRHRAATPPTRPCVG